MAYSAATASRRGRATRLRFDGVIQPVGATPVAAADVLLADDAGSEGVAEQLQLSGACNGHASRDVVDRTVVLDELDATVVHDGLGDVALFILQLCQGRNALRRGGIHRQGEQPAGKPIVM